MYNPGTFCDDRARRGAVAPYGLSMVARQCLAKVSFPLAFCVSSVTLPVMPSLNIRNISEETMKRIKSEAALGGKTLRQYVMERLGETGGEHRGVQAVRAEVAVSAPERREPVAAEPVVALCGHRYGPKKCPFPMCEHWKWGDK